uniref:Uncharacterized protein n=1 Tax=Ditylum brightwellii TaxID=49249 RepID=A0A7S4S0K4_9STRA|mmetsp:Transcript_55961/g.83404  ORF Transcript_55961/g.83404 Transcript_55961/m.83404 type:complete len:464 (-) Transcript_55961:231-1622(-)
MSHKITSTDSRFQHLNNPNSNNMGKTSPLVKVKTWGLRLTKLEMKKRKPKKHALATKAGQETGTVSSSVAYNNKKKNNHLLSFTKKRKQKDTIPPSSYLKGKHCYNSDSSLISSPAQTEVIRRTPSEKEEEEEKPKDMHEKHSYCYIDGTDNKKDNECADSTANLPTTSPSCRNQKNNHKDKNEEGLIFPSSVSITSESSEDSDLDSVTSLSSATIAERIEAMAGIANHDSSRKRTDLNRPSRIIDNREEEKEDDNYRSAHKALVGYKVVNSTSLPLDIMPPSLTKQRQKQEQQNNIYKNTDNNSNDQISDNATIQLGYRHMVMGIPSSVTKPVQTTPSIIQQQRRRRHSSQETKLSKNRSFHEHCFYQAYQVRYQLLGQLLALGCISLLAHAAYSSRSIGVHTSNASFGVLDILHIVFFVKFLVEIQKHLLTEDETNRISLLSMVSSTFPTIPNESPAMIAI